MFMIHSNIGRRRSPQGIGAAGPTRAQPDKQYRQYGIDFARLLAAYMVLSGHLIFGGTFATDDTYISWAGLKQALPLLDQHNQSAWKVDFYLLQHYGTASAIIGVSIFFMISGWLIPPMLHKYSARVFLTNRVFRIFPMLICAVLIAAIIQYTFGYSQTLHRFDVFSTMFLINQITFSSMTLGVVWTLIIEFKFYILLAIIRLINNKKMFGILSCILIMNVVHFYLLQGGYYAVHTYIAQIARSIVHDSYYVVFMFVGVSLWLTLDDTPSARSSRWRFLWPLVVVIIFNANRYFTVNQLEVRPHQDINLVTQFITFGVFGFCLFCQNRCASSHWLAGIIERLSNVTYSVYLLHLSLGIFLLSWLRHLIINQYFLLFVVVSIITLIAALTYQFIEVPGNRMARRLIAAGSKRSPDGAQRHAGVFSRRNGCRARGASIDGVD